MESSGACCITTKQINKESGALDPKRVEEFGSEYRIAYQQLQLVERKIAETLTLLENDRRLAERRYQLARKAYTELALGEDDEFLAEEED